MLIFIIFCKSLKFFLKIKNKNLYIGNNSIKPTLSFLDSAELFTIEYNGGERNYYLSAPKKNNMILEIADNGELLFTKNRTVDKSQLFSLNVHPNGYFQIINNKKCIQWISDNNVFLIARCSSDVDNQFFEIIMEEDVKNVHNTNIITGNVVPKWKYDQLYRIGLKCPYIKQKLFLNDNKM